MTTYPEIFEALAEPFRDDEIKQRRQGSLTLNYATARTYMNRLDEVLGPENWWDDYVSGEDGVMGILTIRLPGGEIITKRDVGGAAGMADTGDDEKSAYSDAFKRVCVKFGVGRFLYPDSKGVNYRRQVKKEFYVLPRATANKEAIERFTAVLKTILHDANPDGVKEMSLQLYKRAVEHELAYDELEGIDAAKARMKLSVLFAADPGRMCAWMVKQLEG